jgi:hypothetical protein
MKVSPEVRKTVLCNLSGLSKKFCYLKYVEFYQSIR